ncbi:ABC transporter substrate-binding protein [Anaerocolumna sp.]|uniref:ABC transporter substrate-binding protein n=1 Tax=Anaerocolumna sp. TaxID=2041569 RepID=UPI0028B16325|nr:ABC transporter substrate-binding protein [Anaerocolumna sp.]
MKKILSIIFVMVMAISLVACGTKKDRNNGGEGKDNTNTAGDEKKDADDKDTAGGAKEKLIVGTEPGFAPYEYMEGDKVVGIDMDIAKAIADAMGKELEIKTMDFDGALLAVQQGKVDFVAAGVSVDEDRQKVMDFSADYVNSTEVVVTLKDNAKVSSVDDLNDKVIGVQQGNIADIYVSNPDNVAAKEVKRYKKFAQASEDLKNGKIDCIVMDLYPAQELVAANSDLVILDGVLFEDKYAIAVKKGNQELLDQINEVINQLIEDGKIEEFTANHTAK